MCTLPALQLVVRKGNDAGKFRHALVTASLIWAGCAFVCKAIRAAPCRATQVGSAYARARGFEHVLCAASSNASARGRPIITPPSAIASSTTHANAGPEPESAVHASKCFSSKKRHRPIVEKICRMIERSSSCVSEGGRVETTVMPSRICICVQSEIVE